MNDCYVVSIVSAAGVSSEAARIRQQELDNLRGELYAERERSKALEKTVQELEDARRGMHNQIQELRGSVRVFVRARPFLASDGEDASSQVHADMQQGYMGRHMGATCVVFLLILTLVGAWLWYYVNIVKAAHR